MIVDARPRAETIRTEARNLAFAQGLELIEDEGLLKETAGLVEWPVVLMGTFDESFLAVPPEVIATSIKNHQKCFALRNAKTGKLANRYLLVSNLVAKDGGKTIIAGNNKVIAARLSDAKFFWDQDRKVKLEDWATKLDAITFHAKLGTQGERVQRIEALAAEIAKTIGADPEQGEARRAARQGRSRHRHGRRVPGTAGPDGPLLRARPGHRSGGGRRHPRPLQAGRPHRLRFPSRRSARPWRWPTSSTRWSASGRSTRSRRARRTPMRCAARRWASSA